jgi:hypothetical protein
MPSSVYPGATPRPSVDMMLGTCPRSAVFVGCMYYRTTVVTKDSVAAEEDLLCITVLNANT